MAIYYRQIDDTIIISGKTYPYKDLIKSFGGRFQSGDKVWSLPDNEQTLAEIDRLCKSVGGGRLKLTPTKPAAKRETPSRIVETHSSLESPQGLSISDLMHKVSLEIQSAFPRAVWVYGEVQSLNKRPSGYFLQIADFKENSSKSATMTANVTLWQSTAKTLTAKLKNPPEAILQEGLKVRILVQVGFYKDRGSITLNILDIDPNFTKGALALAREELLKELRNKGLATKNKALAGSSFPFKIGLISAPNSRAYSDFMDQLKVYGYPGTVVFIPTQMQGENTPAEVSTGIERLILQEVDYIVMTRGGGSHADLRWFDDKKIALAIANSPIPIISAIGHHDDVCVAEEISFHREKTPTAAADYILGRFAEVQDKLVRAGHAILQFATQKINREQEKLSNFYELLKSQGLQALNSHSELLGQLSFEIQRTGTQRLHQAENNLLQLGMQLAKYSFEAINYQDNLQKQYTKQLEVNLQKTVHRAEQGLAELSYQIKLNTQQCISHWTNDIQSKESFFRSIDPRPWLEKGWTQLVQGQRRIRNADDINEKELVFATISDAKLSLKVDRIEREHHV